MSAAETPGQKARKARARKPQTIEGKAREIAPQEQETAESAKAAEEPRQAKAGTGDEKGAGQAAGRGEDGRKMQETDSKGGKASADQKQTHAETGTKPQAVSAASGTAERTSRATGPSGPGVSAGKTDKKEKAGETGSGRQAAGASAARPETAGTETGPGQSKTGTGAQARSSAPGSSDAARAAGAAKRTGGFTAPLLTALLAGAVAGGVVSLGVLWSAGLLPPAQTEATGVDPARVAALEEDLDTLRQNLPQAGADSGSGEAVAALRSEISALEQRLNAIEQAPQADGADAADAAADPALAGRIEDIESRLAALDEEIGTYVQDASVLQRVAGETRDRLQALSGTVQQMQERLAALESRDAADADGALARAAGLLPALMALEADVAAGRPVLHHRETLISLGLSPEEAGALIEDPPASDATIAEHLAAARTALARAEAEAEDGDTAAAGDGAAAEGILSQLQQSLSGLVTVRPKADPQAPSPLDPVVEAVAAGRFAEALSRLQALSGATQVPAMARLAAALEARAGFETRLAEVRSRIMAELAGGN